MAEKPLRNLNGYGFERYWIMPFISNYKSKYFRLSVRMIFIIQKYPFFVHDFIHCYCGKFR